MIYAKKYGRLFLLIIILLFVLSSTALSAGYDPHYVIYENPDGEYIIADYAYALELITVSGKYQLYEKIVGDIQVALYNHREVYVITEDDKIINYSLAVDEGKTLTEAYDDYATFGVAEADLPEPDLELYISGNIIAYRKPVPLIQPDWFEINYAWYDLANCWFINFIVYEAEFAAEFDGKTLSNITKVTYKGIDASRKDNIFRFRTFNENNEPDVSLINFKVYIDGVSVW
ncbi:MAG: hypothetical protein ACNA7Z_03725 [Dethiobacteria bacterium]